MWRNVEKGRERERLKTLPYMPNFQKEPSIDSREPQGSVSNLLKNIELVVRKEDSTSNRRLSSLNFNLSLSLIVIESQVEKPGKPPQKPVEKAETKGKGRTAETIP